MCLITAALVVQTYLQRSKVYILMPGVTRSRLVVLLPSLTSFMATLVAGGVSWSCRNPKGSCRSKFNVSLPVGLTTCKKWWLSQQCQRLDEEWRYTQVVRVCGGDSDFSTQSQDTAFTNDATISYVKMKNTKK